ncbi:unnamed protein product [Closterium sp. NIES-54]
MLLARPALVRSPAASRASRPAAACESCPAALPSAHRPALQPAPSCPAALCALLPCPQRAPLPCSLRRTLPCPALPSCAAQAKPHRPARAVLLNLSRAALLNPSRAALPHSPALPSRPPATTATAARAFAAGGGGAAGSAGGAGEAAALGSGESAAAPSASEFAAPFGAHESADTLGASASTATAPASTEALHTFTLDSGASRCFFRDCTTVTPLAALVLVSLADPTGDPPGSDLYTLTTESAQVAESGQVAASSRVSASGQIEASCSCRILSHQTLLWHHRLGHPSLPRLHSMHSRLLVSGLPSAPLSLLRVSSNHCSSVDSHMDVWGPAPVGGMDRERYFLLVVDDYTCNTTVFPLRRKADVNGVLIPWIRATHHQLRERFQRDLPILRLHSNKGGCSYLHDPCAPHFLWPFAIRYAAHHLNLWPRVSEPETLPTLRWTGKVGDASGFRDVTFDESVCFYRLHPHASHPVPLAPLFQVPVPPPP